MKKGVDMNKTSMLYWYPKICKIARFRTPRTLFLKMPKAARLGFYHFFDNEDGEMYADPHMRAFIDRLGGLGEQVGYPLFLRTHLTSGKHGWRRTCHVEMKDSLLAHVISIIEYSECASMPGLDWSVWAVRELLPTTPAFVAFEGMPIVCEFRVFARDGEELCWHPYWPAGAIEGHVGDRNWRRKLRSLQNEPNDEAREIARLASRAVPGDAWSIDVLKTEKGWYVIDMAPASESYHWPDCENAGKFQRVGASFIERSL